MVTTLPPYREWNRVNPGDNAVVLDFWSGGHLQTHGTPTDYTRRGETCEKRVTYKENNLTNWGILKYVKRAEGKKEFDRDWQNQYCRWDLGSNYGKVEYRVFDYPMQGIQITGKAPRGGNGYAGTCSQYIDPYSTCQYAFPSSVQSRRLGTSSNMVPETTSLMPVGTTMIAATIPNQPMEELIPALVEGFTEGLPSLGDVIPRSINPKEFARAFLGWEFGVKSFTTDVQKSLHAIVNSKRILAEFASRYEKTYRRHRLSEPETHTTSHSYDFTVYSKPWTYLYDWSSVYSDGTIQESTVVRFAAEYLYFQVISTGLLKQVEEHAAMANRLLGMDPTRLSNIWESLPWTWLVDWVFNVGSIIRNVSYLGRDGLVMRYAYVTMQQTQTGIYKTRGVLGSSFSYRKPFTYKVQRNFVLRRKATPYGFGLNPTTFTQKQWAILAALGITRCGQRL